MAARSWGSGPEDDDASKRRRAYAMAAARALIQLVLVIAFVGGASYAVERLIATKPSAPQKAQIEPVYAVRAVKAEAGFQQPSISVFGEVSARRAVELRALVAGKAVYTNENLMVGARVDEGEVLVRIDDFSYQGAVVEARANLAEAKARLVEAEAQLDANKQDLARVREQVALAVRDLERARSLVARNTLSERTVDERELTLVQRRQSLEAAESAKTIQEARIAQQRAAVARLEWRLEQAERDLEDTALRAPFDAIIRAESVGLGKRLGVNDVVAQLYEADALDVRFTLSDSRFGRLSAAATPLTEREAEIVWDVGDAPIRTTASIERIGADVSSASGGVSVLARVDQTDARAAAALRPGAFVTVTLPDRGFENSYRLPEASLYDGDHVYALIPGEAAAGAPRVWRLDRRPAEVLAWDAAEVLVRGDLDGLWILTSRLAEAGDDVKVRLFDAPAADSNAAPKAAAPPRAAVPMGGPG